MHLVREELHIATDAAAKAAVTGLSLGGTRTDAINQAIAYAAKNTVAGAPLRIDASNVQIGGRSTTRPTGDGRSPRTPTPLTAASVTVNMATRHDDRHGEPVLRPAAGNLHVQPRP